MKDTASFSASIDKTLLKRTKVAATKLGVPISALVSQQLQAFLDPFEHSEKQGNQNYQILAEFSLGLRSADNTMQALSIPSHVELGNLLAAAKLPRPAVFDNVVIEMIKELNAFTSAGQTILIPDSGPLLALLRQQKLDSLFTTFSSLAIPDAVVHELVRYTGDEGRAIAKWISQNNIPIFDTRAFGHGQRTEMNDGAVAHGVVVDLCLQEIMNETNLSGENSKTIFLLDEHKCVGTSTFLLGKNCRAATLDAFARFLSTGQFSASAAMNNEENATLPVATKPKAENKPDPTPQPESKDDRPDSLLLSALDVANPKLVEKRLRELAGQTAQLSRKTIDAFKARNRMKEELPAPEEVEQFRRNLV